MAAGDHNKSMRIRSGICPLSDAFNRMEASFMSENAWVMSLFESEGVNIPEKSMINAIMITVQISPIFNDCELG
jgi:hypothetical protein